MKSTLKISLAAAAVSLVFAAGYAKGQDGGQKDEAAKIDSQLSDLQASFAFASDPKERNDLSDQMLDFYDKGKTSPLYRERILRASIRGYAERQPSPDAAIPNRGRYEDAMFRLQLLQTQQNERIIQLLEQQQKAK